MEAPLQSAFLDLLVCGEGELDKVQTLQPLPHWNLFSKCSSSKPEVKLGKAVKLVYWQVLKTN
jgi:hypothetical protein